MTSNNVRHSESPLSSLTLRQVEAVADVLGIDWRHLLTRLLEREDCRQGEVQGVDDALDDPEGDLSFAG